MKPVSSEFLDAFNEDTMFLNKKLIVEFGNNRFNDGQVVTASSTKMVNRGLNSLLNNDAEFWKASDVFNNQNKNNMKWLVLDCGALLPETADGSGYRCITLDNEDNPTDYEKGWWSANLSDGSGIFAAPEWVQSEFFEDDEVTPFQRRTNKITLFLTEGYPNMSEVTVQYKDVDEDWIDVANGYDLGPTEYEVSWEYEEDVIITGLRVYINSTQEPEDFARVNELNAFWTKDISEYVVNADISETREEYDRTVPVGTTAANTLDVQLENVDGLFNQQNNDSVYAPYLGANCRVECYLGIDVNQGVGSPDYEYVQMGEFWTDEWSSESGSMTASFNSRDFSKFLQDDKTVWGRVWRNTNILPVMRDVLLMLGLPLDRINIDETNLRGYQLLYIHDTSPWEFFGEVAMADQGMFGFDYEGNFYYQSYNVLNDAPYDEPVITLNWDTNIIDGDNATELYVNKVKVEVSPLSDTETGRRKIWGAESPTILSYAKLAGNIDADDTSISVQIAPRQETGNLTANGWNDRGGYLFIPSITATTITLIDGVQQEVYTVEGGELIKYASRSDSTFLDCQRGHLDTVAQSWTDGAYIGEARVWDMEFDNTPASQAAHFVTAIDSYETDPDERRPQAYVIYFEADSFVGRLAIGNIVNYLTWLAGTGQSMKDFDNKNADAEYNHATSIAGYVSVEKTGKSNVIAIDTPTALNADLIRRYGKNEIEISNDWIQTRDHAEDIANVMIDEYKRPRRVVRMQTSCHPALMVRDRVRISNFPQLDIENTDYHIIDVQYSYDGGLSTTLTLREVK